MDDQRLDQSKY